MTEDLEAYKKVRNAMTVKRRHDKDLVVVEIPRSYRDWFKQHAAEDGTTMGVAINAALESFMEKEEAR
jgi:hypothetical protein